MTATAIFSLASQLREKGNSYILKRLHMAGVTGIVPSHGDILAFLFDQGPASMGTLARSIGRSKSTVTALVTKLEAQGYLARHADPADARGIVVSLRPKGERLRPLFQSISTGLGDMAQEKLSAEELALLEQLLRKCLG